MRAFFKKYKHAWILLYFPIYLAWFAFLEKTVTRRFHVVHMAVDDVIPFVEFFIIPYLLWFAYVAVGIVYFFLHDVSEYYKLCAFLFVGMTVFLFISTVYPNGHYLRPSVFPRDNLCSTLVRWLYAADTPTNLFPSIHVYNSIGIHLAVSRSQELRKHRGIQIGSGILMLSIILATMFLKQHSVFDVMTALGMAVIMYTVVYGRALQQRKVPGQVVTIHGLTGREL
ncbi:MAG: serine/threonine protein phosphatase [Lachnospiraceae bacterium]|nr:serine/threonine protein phosphatase [Lachnospiraceae bacterium]MCI9148921.1 serine/threonine protein phosphatase [Lachnospiraceae bacterium]